jgi:hypothetical protein
LKTGLSVTATTIVPLPQWLRTRWTEGLHVTAGYKTQGYVPGEQLSGGGLLRAGITIAAR